MSFSFAEIDLLAAALEGVDGTIRELSPAVLDKVSLRADQHFVNCSEFHALEYTTQGTSFRWSGPSRSVTFWLFLDPQKRWTTRLRFLTSLDLRNYQHSRLLIDGEHSTISFFEDEHFKTFEGVPFEPTSRLGTQLRFELAGIRSPADDDPANEDVRQLGIAWHDLQLTCE